MYVESLVQTIGRHPETTIPFFSKMPGRVEAVGTLYSTFVLTFARAFVERANVETVYKWDHHRISITENGLLIERLNGVNRQPSNGQKFNRQPLLAVKWF